MKMKIRIKNGSKSKLKIKSRKSYMIHVILPQHLQLLASAPREVHLEIAGPVTQHSILDALETRYPALRGAVRDHVTQKRRPMVRLFRLRRGCVARFARRGSSRIRRIRGRSVLHHRSYCRRIECLDHRHSGKRLQCLNHPNHCLRFFSLRATNLVRSVNTTFAICAAPDAPNAARILSCA